MSNAIDRYERFMVSGDTLKYVDMSVFEEGGNNTETQVSCFAGLILRRTHGCQMLEHLSSNEKIIPWGI